MIPAWQLYLVAFAGVAALFGLLSYFQRQVVAEAYTDSPSDAPGSSSAARQQPATSVAPTLSQSSGHSPLPLNLWIKLVDHVPHLAILGPTNSGKTTLAEAILRLLLDQDAERQAVIIDPKWRKTTPPKWGGLTAAMLDDQAGYGKIEQTLEALFCEFRSRVRRLQAGEPLGSDVIVIWDEINDAMEEIAKTAGAILRRGLRIWREYRMKLIIFPQSDRVEALGLSGHGDARKNLLWLYLGEDALTKARELAGQKVVDAAFVEVLRQQARPAIMVWMNRAYIIDTSEAPVLAAQPLDPARAWPLPTSETPETQPKSFRVEETPVSGVAITKTPETPSCETDAFLALARLVKAKAIGETKGLEIAFGVTPGSSKKYQAAHAQLKAALAQLDVPAPVMQHEDTATRLALSS
jgi:hypothetical protein